MLKYVSIDKKFLKIGYSIKQIIGNFRTDVTIYILFSEISDFYFLYVWDMSGRETHSFPFRQTGTFVQYFLIVVYELKRKRFIKNLPPLRHFHLPPKATLDFDRAEKHCNQVRYLFQM